MKNRMKAWSANLALLFASLFLTFAVFEFGVFKYILPAEDVLPSVTINKVLRYQPNTRAVFHRPDGSTDLVKINAEGWNSTRAYYPKQKGEGRLRVAVIGDSYVHGAFVDVDHGFPEVVEAQLKADGVDAEVFRFGADGAPLSQYLNVLRREVLAFKPDVVVFQLIHNDFDESYRFLGTRYASAFMKVGEDETGKIVDIAPQGFTPGLADKLRGFRSFRYLYYQTGLYKRVSHLAARYWWGGEGRVMSEEFISSAVDIRNIQDHEAIKKYSSYIFKEIRALGEKHGFKPVFAMDGVREAVYAKKPVSDYAVGALNEIVAKQMAELNFAYVDLHDKFSAHFARHGKRFEFPYDWHWNELGNEVVGEAVATLIKDVMKRSNGKKIASMSNSSLK